MRSLHVVAKQEQDQNAEVKAFFVESGHKLLLLAKEGVIVLHENREEHREVKEHANLQDLGIGQRVDYHNPID